MKASRVWMVFALGGGALALLAGLGLVAMYVYGAILEPLGEPDQSLLFWMSPFLLIGVAATLVGIVLIALGIAEARRARLGSQTQPAERPQVVPGP